MALSDTAALVSSLELKDKFTPTVNKFDKSISALERRSGTLGKVGGRLTSGLGSAFTNITKLGLIAGSAIGVGLAANVRTGIDSLRELDAVTRQTNAVLRSTGGAARLTAKDIAALSEKYEDLNATIDNKVIQSAENVLLTFTSIRKDAFEPALKAALDMNEALGGGEGGLQGTIIQVGKALQDPIKGITALRRVGVNFSEQQTKQIKDLIKHNKLYEAQQLILKELTKEFGGSFAAAGKGADGTFAKLGDTIEDLQMSLASALLPALVDVAKGLQTAFASPTVKGAVAELGKGLGEAFKNAVAFAKQIPWASVASSIKTAAGAAGELVKAFVNAPDWLKTAVITGWGLNKLTGGALTGIGGDLLKGLGSRFLDRGSSPVNPLFVSMTGVPGVGGVAGAGALGKAASLAQKVFIVGMVAEVADLIQGAISPGGGLEGRTAGAGGGLLAGDKLAWPFGPKNTPHVDLGPWKDILRGDSTFSGGLQGIGSFKSGFDTGGGSHSEDRKIELNNIEAIRANTVALRASAATIEKTWLKTIDPEDIAARSKAKSGHAATSDQIARIRTGDVLHQLKVITEKSKASTDVKLERLRVLAADSKARGDTKTAAKIQTAIDRMKSSVASAVAVGAAAVVGAVVGKGSSPVNVYVTTNLTANSVTRTTTKVARYGNTGGDRRYDP